MFVLDTNVLSELRKASEGRADPAVVAWAASHEVNRFYISAITLMEIETGVLLMERRDPAQGAKLRLWMSKQVLRSFSGRVLPVDATVALRSATLHLPDPRPERDAQIAATALVHGMTIVTRNVRDFALTGVALINPWQDPVH